MRGTLPISLLLIMFSLPFIVGSSLHTVTPTPYYVSPAGSDANDGRSDRTPFATIQHAVDMAQPGDTIRLAEGRYHQDVITRRDGTAAAPITISGPPAAVVEGSGRSTRIVEINHSHITLEGFTIDGLAGDPASKSSYRNKLLYLQGKGKRRGVSGVRVLHMTLTNAGGECVRLRYFAQGNEIAYNTIANCGVYDFRFDKDGKNGEGIYIGTAPEQLGDGKNPTADPDASNDNWIHHNTFNTQGNECVDLKEGAQANIIEHNRCTGQRDPKSGGFDSRGSGNIFRYNEIYSNVGAGIRLGGDTAADGTDNIVVFNAIHDNMAGGIKFEASPQHEVCGNRISNNGRGNAVGSKRSGFDPTAPCAGAASRPSVQPARPPSDSMPEAAHAGEQQ